MNEDWELENRRQMAKNCQEIEEIEEIDETGTEPVKEGGK